MSLFFPDDTGDMYDYLPGQFVYGDDEYVPEEYMEEKWWYADGSRDYMISSEGRCWSSKSHKILKPKKMDKAGHVGYCLHENGDDRYRYAHRMMGEAFIPNPDRHPNVLHWDDVPDNNTLENLRWGTQRHNHEDCVRNGHFKAPTNADREKGFQKVRKPIIATNLHTGENIYFIGQCEAARTLGIQQANIWKVLNGTRRHAGGYSFRYAEK